MPRSPRPYQYSKLKQTEPPKFPVQNARRRSLENRGQMVCAACAEGNCLACDGGRCRCVCALELDDKRPGRRLA